MADHCNICDTRNPEGGTNHLILNGGDLWIEFCTNCEDSELTNQKGEVKTVKELFYASQDKETTPTNEVVKPKNYSNDEHRKWQEENKETVINKFDFVKIKFTQDLSLVEWMWVIVSEISEDELIGTLDNYPISITNLKCGDLVEFNRKDISGHIRK